MKFKLALLPLVCLLSTTLTGCVDDKINSLNEMDSYLQEQIDSLNNEIKDLKDQIKKLREEMEAASQALQDDYNAKIAKIEEEIEALKTELQELTDQFNADKEALTNDYNTKINNLQTFINEKIEELNARIKEDEDALKALETKHDNDKAALEADYNTKITNLTSSFNAQLTEATTDYNTKLAALEAKHNEDKQALIDDYTAKIAALAQTDSEGRTALQNEFNTKLAALETKHNNDKAALETDYNAKLATLEGKLETAKEELEDDYNAKITALDENYANQVLNLQAQITANKNSIDTFKSQYLTDKAAIELDYNTKITNLRTTYENKVLEIEQSILEKGNAITALEEEMNEALLTLQNDYNAKINALTTRVATLETKTYHTVTFDTLGGSHIEPVLVEHGEKAAKPANPSKAGYTFDGWFYQGEPWVFFGYVVTEDITLSAKWTTINYSITYNLNGATSFDYESNPSTYTIEDEVTFTNPNKTGYTFLGWYDNSGTQISSISIGTTGDIEINARWNEGNIYTVTLNPNGGEVSETSIEVQYDHLYTLPTPTHDSATFVGWYYEDNLVNGIGDWTIDSDVTLVAKWDNYVEPAIVNANLEEVFADDSGNGAIKFHVENVEIHAFCDRDQVISDKPLAHGYALLGENGEYFAWGISANANALLWNTHTGIYNYNNPNDFLTNLTTKDLTAPVHVDMDIIRCDYMGTKEVNCVITAVRDVALLLTTYKGTINTTSGEKRCVVSLGSDIAYVEAQGLISTICDNYTYSYETNIVSIPLIRDEINYGTLVGTYDRPTKSLINVGFEGDIASTITNNNDIVLESVSYIWNCNETTEGLQTVFKRRYMAASWVVDEINDDRFVSDSNSISGYGMKWRGFTGGAVALNLQNDIEHGASVSCLGFWVYNPSEHNVSLRQWIYKGQGLSSNAEIATVIAKANQWTYIRTVFSSSFIYNFQIADFTNSGVGLIFDDIFIF